MDKRKVPLPLQKLLQLDVGLTNIFCHTFDKVLPPRKCKTYFKALELSCHGIPWIVVWLAFIWLLWNQSLFEMQVNFFVGLIVDIIAVAVLKAATRRRRPASNHPDMMFMVGPDKFSFPSGHVSRSCLIACFFTWLYPIATFYSYCIWVWAITISVSRVLMRRHHILDVVGGLLLGIFETWIIYYLWLSESTSLWLVNWLSEEKIGDIV